MTKLIQLTLSKIKYTGDSIGDDIRIEVDCLNHSFSANRKLSHGVESARAAPIGNFFTNQVSSLPLSVRVIERDIVFNDFGSIETVFKVNTRISAPQNFSAIVEVLETRNYASKKKVVFEVTFEARVTDAVAYVAFTKQGWFMGKYTATKKRVDIVSHLQVRIERSVTDRDYFQIMEGPLRGERVSLAKKNDVSYLEYTNLHTGPVYLMYSLSKKNLVFRLEVKCTR